MIEARGTKWHSKILSVSLIFWKCPGDTIFVSLGQMVFLEKRMLTVVLCIQKRTYTSIRKFRWRFMVPDIDILKIEILKCPGDTILVSPGQIGFIGKICLL